MKRKYLILIGLSFILCSCSSRMSILVKIIGLENSSALLKLEFEFKDPSLTHSVNITDIKIFKNNILEYELVVNSDSSHLIKWQFPNVPEGFKIIYPVNQDTLRKYSKTELLNFEFTGWNKKKGYIGEWEYKPSFQENGNRWVFDQEGNKRVHIESFYESWIGKDIIKIYSNTKLDIESNSISLTSSDNQAIGFDIKLKKENGNLLILTLDKDLKKGEIVNLGFKMRDGNYFSNQVKATGKSSVGIIGKYK